MSGMSICGYLWVAFFVLWVVWAVRTKTTLTRESIGSRFSYMIATVAAFSAMFSGDVPLGWMHIRIIPRAPWIEWLGIAITVGGMAFAIWARAYLGSNWSSDVTVKVDHQLIRSGPYRWVRHPIYSGIILAMIGTALNRRQLRGFVAVVLLWIGFTIKSRIEERFMAATFGPEYEQYKSSTGAMVPRLRF
ncbi:MAG: isoprenylcysteine carboxylmethyltransferase family protein [Candidatus Korobacteraceae bacterium]